MAELGTLEVKDIPLAELKNWEKNPRFIPKEDFEQLKEDLKEGLLAPLLVNKEGIVLGGNMRLRALRESGATKATCLVVDATDDDTMLHYAMRSNQMYGQTDEQKLAELFAPTKLDPTRYKTHLTTPVTVKTIMANYAPTEDREIDTSPYDHALQTYLDGTIKAITTYFSNEEFADIMPRIEAIKKEHELENNTKLFLFLVDYYELQNKA